jgi:hypothetical protein
MTHRYFLTIAFCFFAYCLTAQGPIWNWSNNCGNSSNDKALDVALGSDGSVYTSGFFNGNGTFGSITIGSGSYSKDAFVSKQDPQGNYLWANYVNSGLDDRALGVTVDKDDNVLICGTFWSGMQVGPYYLQGSADSPFIVKYDQNGTLIWAITGGGTGDDHAFDMVTDQNGDIYVTGFLSTHYGPPTCTATFGNLPQFSYSDSIAWLGKVSSTGTWLWVRTFDGADVQRDNDIAIDNAGGVYVVGGFYGQNQMFGPIPLNSVSNSRDIFVTKFDINGNFQWVNQVGGYNDDRANGITYGADGYLYVTGEFRAELNFDGDTLNNNGGPGGKDIFVAKMDVNGGWKWASKAGSDDGGESGRAIASNNQHCIYVTGQVHGLQVQFGDSLTFTTGSNGIQIFVAGIDTAGIWRWVEQAGSPGEDRGYGIEATNDCKVYAVGYFTGPTCTFGPYTETALGLKDGFVARLDVTCFNYVNDSITYVNSQDPQCTPSIQNMLSVNSDINYVSIQNAECMTKGEWRIYNLWGQPVFSTTDMQTKWDGRGSNGNLLPAGTYYYVLNSTEGANVALNGQITIIR